MAKRLDFLDKAKGILIVLVVIGHIWQSGPIFNVIYAFHMPAFFVISGILLHHTKSYSKPFASFLRSRLFSIGIPFLFIELLGCFTDIIRHGISLNWKGYLYNTLTFHFNDPNLWFLMDLFLIELLMHWLIKVAKKDEIIVLLAVLLYFLSRFLPYENAYLRTIRSALYYALFFVAGYCGSAFFIRFNATACWLSPVVVVLVGLFFGKREGLALPIDEIVYVSSGVCGGYTVIQAGKIKLFSALDKALVKTGTNTMIIYGTHHIIYAAIGVALGITDFASTPLVPGIIMLLGVAALEIPIIYVVNRWIPWLAGKRRKKLEPTKYRGDVG